MGCEADTVLRDRTCDRHGAQIMRDCTDAQSAVVAVGSGKANATCLNVVAHREMRVGRVRSQSWCRALSSKSGQDKDSIERDRRDVQKRFVRGLY